MFKNMFSYKILEGRAHVPAAVYPLCGYEYVIASNGVFVLCENQHIRASVSLADCRIRGLKPFDAQAELVLKHGPLPVEILGEIVRRTHGVREEKMFQVVWDGRQYSLTEPPQKGAPCAIEYQRNLDDSGSVFEIHTHPGMPAIFSKDDDEDETGFRIYGVINPCAAPVTASFRVGIYGYMRDLSLKDVVGGRPAGFVDQIEQYEKDIRAKSAEYSEVLNGYDTTF